MARNRTRRQTGGRGRKLRKMNRGGPGLRSDKNARRRTSSNRRYQQGNLAASSPNRLFNGGNGPESDPHTHGVTPHVHNIGINSFDFPASIDPYSDWTTFTGQPQSTPTGYAGSVYPGQDINPTTGQTGESGAHGGHYGGGIPGDWNQDGELNVLDVVGLQNQILNQPTAGGGGPQPRGVRGPRSRRGGQFKRPGGTPSPEMPSGWITGINPTPTTAGGQVKKVAPAPVATADPLAYWGRMEESGLLMSPIGGYVNALTGAPYNGQIIDSGGLKFSTTSGTMQGDSFQVIEASKYNK